MRIAWIVPGGFHPSGTREVIPALLWLAERIARDHELTIVLLGQASEPRRFDLCGAQIIDLGRQQRSLPGARLARGTAQVLRALSGQRWDVVHAFWAHASGVIGGIAGRALRAPVVLSVGGGELVWLPDIGYGVQGRRSGRFLTRRALGLAQVITAGSRFVIQGSTTTAGTGLSLPDDATWLPLGADASRFSGLVERDADGPIRLIHVGSINRVKGPQTTLDVLQSLRTNGHDVAIDWVGEDTLDGEVQARAQAMGLAAHIRFHGFVAHADLVELYREAYLCLQSSLHESQGVAILEAALCGVPTVGTAVGLVSEMAPSCAVARPVGAATRIAEAVSGLIERPDERLRIATAAQRWAAKYDADWTASRFESIYRDLSVGFRRPG